MTPKSPEDPAFVPYYERQGMAAQGVTEEWYERARAQSAQILANVAPERREAARAAIGARMAGEIENLRRFEDREVRRGRLARLDADLEDQTRATTLSVLKQLRSFEDGGAADAEDARKTHEEAVRGLAPDDPKRAEADAWLAAKVKKQSDAAYAECGRLVTEVVAKIDMAEPVIDNAAALTGMDPLELAARKRKAARAAVGSVFSTLVSEGRHFAAERFVDALDDPQGGGKNPAAAAFGFLPDDIGKMREAVKSARARAKAETERAQREAERQTLDGIALASREAMADGSLGSIEDALGRMKAEAENQPEGSRPRVAAMEWARRLDRAADAAADRDCWDAIIDHAADGAEWKPPEGSRMARRYKRLKESYDRQRQAYMAEGMLAVDAAAAEERKANVAALRASMLEAASANPGGFTARLAEMAEKGHVTLDQYRKLRDEFRDTWMQKGMPQKAKALVDILKREFYPEAEYDLGDRLAADPKTGRFGYLKNPDTKKPFEGEDVEYEARVLVPYDPNSWGGLKDFLGINRATHYETEKRTLTSDEQLELLNMALDLARHDGDETHIDPLTREELEKPRVINAADEFQRACTMLRKMKRAETAGDRIQRFAEGLLDVESGFGRFERGKVRTAAEREAGEAKARQSLKAQKRRSFAPKMPKIQTAQGADGEEEETED